MPCLTVEDCFDKKGICLGLVGLVGDNVVEQWIAKATPT